MQHEIDERKKNQSVKTINEEDIVSPDLYNNIGVLRLEVGKIKEAQDAFQKAISNCQQLLTIRKDDSRIKAIMITSRFNLAYWYEQHNQFGEATDLYKQIIKEEPCYVDAYIRLAYLAKKRGNNKRAFEYIEQAK